ncbi:MAG: hypothetical protein HY721_08045 [Planctomycetes bacterium]|nr:hypothetical protein [Planctomycetota bacterium]
MQVDPKQVAAGSEPEESLSKGVVHLFERFTARVGAVAGGIVLMAVGVGLGVTVVLLPVGIVVGLIGLFAFLVGIFGPAFRRQEK